MKPSDQHSGDPRSGREEGGAAPPRPVCAHEPCHCTVAKAGGYCDAYCANAAHQDEPRGACSCGHWACDEGLRSLPHREASEPVISVNR